MELRADIVAGISQKTAFKFVRAIRFLFRFFQRGKQLIALGDIQPAADDADDIVSVIAIGQRPVQRIIITALIAQLKILHQRLAFPKGLRIDLLKRLSRFEIRGKLFQRGAKQLLARTL